MGGILRGRPRRLASRKGVGKLAAMPSLAATTKGNQGNYPLKAGLLMEWLLGYLGGRWGPMRQWKTQRRRQVTAVRPFWADRAEGRNAVTPYRTEGALA